MTLQKILGYLNIKEEESEKVSLLLIQSVSIGGIISFYYTFANGLFISTFSLNKLPVAYVFSGILGLASSFIFSKVQKEYNASKVLQYLLLIVSLFLLVFKATYNFVDDPKITEYLIWIIFIGFVPISTMIAISFAAILMRFFNLREGKRLFPIIYSGEVIASIIAFTLIPIMLKFDKTNDDTSFLLNFSIVGAIVSFFFQFRIYKTYQHLFKIPSKQTKKEVGKINLHEICPKSITTLVERSVHRWTWRTWPSNSTSTTTPTMSPTRPRTAMRRGGLKQDIDARAASRLWLQQTIVKRAAPTEKSRRAAWTRSSTACESTARWADPATS